MPRPKPEKPLKTRGVRMTDSEWEQFRLLGGRSWLSSRLAKLHMTGIVKRQRDYNIRKDRALGMSDDELTRKHNLDRTTIWRIAGPKTTSNKRERSDGNTHPGL